MCNDLLCVLEQSHLEECIREGDSPYFELLASSLCFNAPCLRVELLGSAAEREVIEASVESAEDVGSVSARMSTSLCCSCVLACSGVRTCACSCISLRTVSAQHELVLGEASV